MLFESTGGDFRQWLSNLFTGQSNVMSGPASTGDTPSMAGADFSAMANAGYTVPGSGESSVIPSSDSSGGMNWAGLSNKLSDLSKSLQSGSSSDPMQGSKTVASSTAQSGMSPAGAGGGAGALASVVDARNQLAQYLLLAAMQGKGRGRSGGGLLG